MANVAPRVLGLSLLALGSVASADQGLSEAQTTYIGAVMLEGDVDVTFDRVATGTDAESVQTNYAFFSGNTLYYGTTDNHGNNLDTIVEFFWFESSIDRGSDFYVAIVKARSTPNVDDLWYLDVDDLLNTFDYEPVLSLTAQRSTISGTGAFRWDWSLPFESYGIDSYGTATLTNTYGIGANAEGSTISSTTLDEDYAEIEGTVQTKGYFNTDYKVETQYQVQLYRWDVVVSGSPSEITWDMVLNTGDRDEQSAYHEYFIVMQSDEGVPFSLDSLTVKGSYNGWWLGQDTVSSVILEGITLNRPVPLEEPPEVEPPEEEEVEEDEDSGLFDDEPWYDTDTEEEIDEEPPEEPIDEELPSSTPVGDKSESVERGLWGCSVTRAPASQLGLLGCMGLMLFARRRREV